MLQQTFLFLGQLWQLFEVSQILEILRYLTDKRTEHHVNSLVFLTGDKIKIIQLTQLASAQLLIQMVVN